ncbi:MAG: hypothetical protein QM783_18510 [Phycisphaerales bacterium]
MIDVKVDAAAFDANAFWESVHEAWWSFVQASKPPKRATVYGDGRAGPRIAALLAKIDPHEQALLRKRIVY